MIGNGTVNYTKENSFTVSVKKEATVVDVNITAVDRCGTRGASSSKAMPILSIAGYGSLNIDHGTDTTCTCCHESVLIINTVISSITLVAVLIVIVLIVIVLITRSWHGQSDKPPPTRIEANNVSILYCYTYNNYNNNYP